MRWVLPADGARTWASWSVRSPPQLCLLVLQRGKVGVAGQAQSRHATSCISSAPRAPPNSFSCAAAASTDGSSFRPLGRQVADVDCVLPLRGGNGSRAWLRPLAATLGGLKCLLRTTDDAGTHGVCCWWARGMSSARAPAAKRICLRCGWQGAGTSHAWAQNRLFWNYTSVVGQFCGTSGHNERCRSSTRKRLYGIPAPGRWT
jgi:hypothetical protein